MKRYELVVTAGGTETWRTQIDVWESEEEHDEVLNFIAGELLQGNARGDTSTTVVAAPHQFVGDLSPLEVLQRLDVNASGGVEHEWREESDGTFTAKEPRGYCDGCGLPMAAGFDKCSSCGADKTWSDERPYVASVKEVSPKVP